MPRFFFHHLNGAVTRDGVGLELADMAAVRHEAVRVLAEALGKDPASFWPVGTRQMTVADDEDLTLFTLDVTATFAPAYQP